MLEAKSVLPWNVAVIECEPIARVEIVSCAALLITAVLPSVVEPSRKVTAPTTELPAPAWTVAVNVTDCPASAGFALEASVVVVVSCFTVSVNAGDVLVAKLPLLL